MGRITCPLVMFCAAAAMALAASSALAGPWSEEAKLTASDGAAEDYFGCSVSLSGDYTIIGTYGDDDNGTDSGSAYILGRGAGGAWVEAAKLTASDAAQNDWFGCSVSIRGDHAIVGAYRNGDSGKYSGSAYVFERAAGGAWSQVAKLTASDATAGAAFGYSVSISGDHAIVGASGDDSSGVNSGSAYVFERGAGGAWSEVAKLIASDGAQGDQFGHAVSISGDHAIVGARYDNDSGTWSGSAYVFERGAGGVWGETAKLTASDGVGDARFGSSVSLDADYAVVGASCDDDNGHWSGSAYIFERGAAGVWGEAAKLTASDGAGGDSFGCSVSLSGDCTIIGACNDDGSGSGYIFERGAGGAWSEAVKLTAYDGAAGDSFGYSVSLSGDCAIVGAWYDDDNGLDSGSAYMITPEPGALSLLGLGGLALLRRRRG